MAKTTVASNDALVRKAVNEQLYRDHAIESFFMGNLMGESTDSVIQVENKLTKDKGDAVSFGLRVRLTGEGRTSGQTMEDNEESLTTHNFTVTLEQYKNAVRDSGPLDRKRPVWDVDAEGKSALVTWGAEKIDKLIFASLQASPTKTFRPNSRATKAALTATDLITPLDIARMRSWAVTGGARAQTPFRKVKVNGGKYFVLVVHPDVMYDLFRNSEFTQTMREADLRGIKENGLFNAAKAVWQDVIIMESEHVTIGADAGGAAVPYADCMFLGAQAGVWAWGQKPEITSKEFDYDDEHGHKWSIIAAAGKSKFNNLDYGVAAFQTARTNVSGATN